MKKKLLLFRLFALVAAMACALGAGAEEFYSGGIYYTFSDDYNGVEVYEGPNDGYYTGSLTIPSTVTYGGKTYNVVGIFADAFHGCEGLTSVTIPNTVKIIRTEAFSWCTGLTRVTIPASVQYIGFYAFNGCTNLMSITCMGTTPPQFYDLDSSTEYLNPFSDVTYTRATLYVPKGCKSAYQQTGYWKYWYKFTKIEVVDWDFSVDGFCYNYSLGYENGYGSENGVVLSDYVGGNNASSVVIPSTVQYGGKTYDVIGIGECAFGEFPQMTSVTIPESVVWIGLDAFYACTNLSSVTCLANNPPAFYDYDSETEAEVFRNVTYSNATLTVPRGCKSAYQKTGYWKYWYKFSNIQEQIWDFVVNRIYYAITGSNTVKVTHKEYNSPSYSGSVSIPATVTSGGITYTVTAIDNYAFSGCNVTSVTIPNTVTTIGVYAFSNSGLTSVTIGSSLKTIGYGAFIGCSNLTSVTLPNALTTISDQAFKDCTSLASVTFGNSLASIGYEAFENCTALTSLTLPNSLSDLGERAFFGCTRLQSVTLPNAITTIKPSTFCYTGLTSVTIPNSVTTIGGWAFGRCENLASVVIGSGVTYINDRAFGQCPALINMTCWASTPPTMAAKTVFDDGTYSYTSRLTVLQGKKSSYESADWWKDFVYIVEKSYDFVVNGIYYTITGSNTVEVATKDALAFNTYSGAVTIPSTVTYGGKTYTVTGLGFGCFAWCTLTSLSLPNTITYIGQNAFSICKGLTTMTLPSSLTEIGAGAFSFSLSLTQLTIPNSVTYIGDQAFSYSRYITSLTLPSNLVYLGEKALEECSGLTSLVIPGGVTRINGGTFTGCTSLTAITIPNNVTYIGKQAFMGCTGLTTITVPNNVTYIGYDAFKDCTGLTIVTLGTSLRTDALAIAQDAFSGCTALTTVNSLCVTPPMIHANAFTSDQYTTATLTVPEGSLSAYQAADNWKNFTTIQERDYDFVVNGIYYSITGAGTVSVSHGPLANCYSGNIVIPESVTYLGMYFAVTGISRDAFRGQYNSNNSVLTSVIIPNGVTTIKPCAFMGCTQLSSIVIPPSVTTIGYQAFLGCTALANVTLGQGVTDIDFYAFRNCSSLTAITCLATEPPVIGSDTFLNENYNGVTLFVPKTSLEAYRDGYYWQNFSTIKPHLYHALAEDDSRIGFDTSADHPWTNVVEDDRVYARSTNKGVHGSTSTLVANVILPHDGAVSFDFKAWGEGTSYDICAFMVDGIQQFSYGAKKNDWENYTAQLSAGKHQLTWVYLKDWSVNPVGDYFAIDNVVITVNVGRGDVDGDGKVGIGDVTALVDYLLNGDTSGIYLQAADVDGDGSVGIGDVTGLIDYLLSSTWDDEPVTPSRDWVDLGLPSGTLWATMNVGASSPEEYGNYYAWGETTPKEIYNWGTYWWCNGSSTSLTKYCTNSLFGSVDNKDVLDPEDDAATVNWGPEWQMPTAEQQQELYSNCTMVWTTLNGVTGRLLTGPNGNTLFLPAAGYHWNETLYDEGLNGSYWSRSLGSTGSYDWDDPDAGYDPGDAFNIYFYSTEWSVLHSDRRTTGCSVRPVRVSQ